MEFICYKNCTTCKKAEKWLAENKIEFEKREITENTPTKEELKKWQSISNKEIKGLFNTSGQLYRSMNLKDKLKDMNDDEKFELLSSDAVLIKRPILVTKEKVLFGFKEGEYEDLLSLNKK